MVPKQTLTSPRTKSAGDDATAANGRAAYSIREFCSIVGVGRSRAYREIAAGRLKVLKCGKRTLVRATEVEAWLDRLEDEPSRAPGGPHHAPSTE